jgi:branched-chain amino acid transport system permease protein
MSTALDLRAKALQPSLAAAAPRIVMPYAIGIALAFAAQLVIAPAVGPFVSKLLMDIGINVVLAVSLNMVNGFTGQFSIGHAAFMAVGGYTAGAVTYYGSFLLWGSANIHGGFLGGGDLLFLSGCLAGGLMAAGAGFVVGLPSLRLRGDYLAIVTLGFGEIVRVIVQRTDDVKFTAAEVEQASVGELARSVGGALGFNGIPFYTTVFWVYVFVAITMIVSYRLKVSSYGRAFLSIRENEIAAEAMGVDTTRYKVRAFVIAAFFAGIAGALFAHEVGTTLNPRELGFQKSFDILIMVVLGGLGSISGAAIAAVILTILPEALRGFADYRMIVYALLLIVMMIVRPQGLFGIREIWELAIFRRRSPKT